MIKCILAGKFAISGDIQAATPAPVLATWKSVRKDRCEGTAYVTAWKRIQEKLTVVQSENGNYFLCFGSNGQFVASTSQWQDIVMSFHCDDNNMKHFGVKDTIDRVRKVWTVGGKMYGIPESFIRACVGACRVCGNGSGGSGKRRRFEYTESFEVSARDVCRKLRQLAVEHKVVLCIRQKYIKYKPFMAEVKDYACHRAGEPGLKKSRGLKREPYASKRCGCGFRIRAIVPICDYNEKDKTFVYQEEGMAVFKLHAVHSGHEPGPLDGNARIMHRLVGGKGGFSSDQDLVYGISDEGENENSIGNDDSDGGDTKDSVLHQVNELKHEVGLLEGKILKMQPELLNSVSQELFDLVSKVRNVGEYGSKSSGLVFESDLVNWNAHQNADLIVDDDDSFERTHENVGSWDHINGDCRNEKDLVDDTCKSENWLKCNTFHEKTILDCEDFKIKPVRNDETQTETNADTLVGLQVDNFFPENHKWYDSSCGLDPGMDCGSNGYRLGEIV
ncbi:hypothetical protein CTI12_AA336900 [Artemisia annua]|uniref:Uncharacterized protein n=1 Tax=Artemisia annua TaxID=35608 RepID=A0A2U1MW78_ARTAN|nr:hypothetical protein CTI12_AA336900 [Artemisia annua]